MIYEVCFIRITIIAASPLISGPPEAINEGITVIGMSDYFLFSALGLTLSYDVRQGSTLFILPNPQIVAVPLPAK